MTALRHDGRGTDVLCTYTKTREICFDELGVEPSGATEALRRAIAA